MIYPIGINVLFEKMGGFYQWTWSGVTKEYSWSLCWWPAIILTKYIPFRYIVTFGYQHWSGFMSADRGRHWKPKPRVRRK